MDANALERETLERKDRDELQKIVGALGGKATTRTRKADLIDQILELTGVTERDDAAADGDTKADEAKGASGKAAADDAEGDGADAEADSGDAKAGDGKAGDAKAGGRSSGDGGSRDQKTGDQKGDRKNGAARSDDGGKDAKAQSGGSRGSGQNGGGQGSSSSGGGQNDGANGSDGDGGDDQDGAGKRRRRRGRNRDGGGQEEYTGDPIPVAGVLDLRDDGYGFLRVDGMLPSKDDCYVSVKQVRQFGLRKGDLVAGGSRPAFRNEKNPAILRIDQVNDADLEPGTERPLFEELRAEFPSEAISLVLDDDDVDERIVRTTRAVDLLAPVGKGSRVLISGAPRSGRTTMLQALARAIEANEPDVKLLVVLVDERPEELTEMQGVVAGGTVHGTSFDGSADDHVATVELALARARRMAEAGDDVVVLLDGVTRLARAHHAANQGVGRSLGGLDVTAVEAAKRAMGAGRKLADAGSVTLIATATSDTGEPADEAVLDAVVPAANVHVQLDRAAAERRAFPALDVGATTSRHAELLVGDDGAAQREDLRVLLTELAQEESSGKAGMLDGLLDRLRSTGANDELLTAAAKERDR